MIQILLHNLKMDPLVSLHYYAPVCAIINLFLLPFTEGLEPFYQLKDLGALVLLSNAAVAFLLNVAAVFLVGVASSLVLTLSGVFKVSCPFCFPLFFFCLQVSTWILTGGTCWSSYIVVFAVSLCSVSIVILSRMVYLPCISVTLPLYCVGMATSDIDFLCQPQLLMLFFIFDHPSQALSFALPDVTT